MTAVYFVIKLSFYYLSFHQIMLINSINFNEFAISIISINVKYSCGILHLFEDVHRLDSFVDSSMRRWIVISKGRVSRRLQL